MYTLIAYRGFESLSFRQMKTAYLLDFLVFTRFFRVYISIPDDFFPSKTTDFALNRNSMQHEMQHEKSRDNNFVTNYYIAIIANIFSNSIELPMNL